MIHHALTKSESSSPAVPCVVLALLQADLAAILKSRTLPFKRSYSLNQDSRIEISIEKLDDGQFQLELISPNWNARLTEPKPKKLIDMAHMFTWRALSTTLRRIKLSPCTSMAHSGADEILALYQCLETVKDAANLPYTMTIKGPTGPYELFSARQKGTLIEVVIETNYVYGGPMKWRAEVEFTHQIADRAAKIIDDVLAEWLRPGGTSLRHDLDREIHFKGSCQVTI